MTKQEFEAHTRHKMLEHIQELKQQNKELYKALEALNKHVNRMQLSTTNYLSMQGNLRSDESYIRQLIYHLDGPEQREIQENVQALLNKYRGENE